HDIADSLAARGVHRVAGRLVAAGNAFPGPVLGFGWSWEDLESSYSAGVDELLFNEGFSEIHIHAGDKPGDPARVETRPARTFPGVRASVATTAAPACAMETSEAAACPTSNRSGRAARRLSPVRAHKDTLTGDIVVEGSVAVGDSAMIEVTHRDPDLAYL